MSNPYDSSGKVSIMTDRDTARAALRDRLADLLTDWDTEFSEERRHEDAEIVRLKAEVGDLVDQLESARAQLETDKALTRSVETLKTNLKEKDDTIEKLEVCVNRYTDTILELKLRADDWKERYEGLKAANVDPDATSTELYPLGGEAEVG